MNKEKFLKFKNRKLYQAWAEETGGPQSTGSQRVGHNWATLLSLSVTTERLCCHSLWAHGLQHARLPCPSPFPGACSNSCPLSRCCHPTISSSVVPFSSCLQSFPASGYLPVRRLFASGGQSIGASAQKCIQNTKTKTDQSSWQEKQQHNFFKFKLPRLTTCA